MLTSLSIENIAVIERADLVFANGLNILTGETGAGKSIVLDSIHAILGDRTPRDLIRTGAAAASVSALFENLSTHLVETLSEFGVDCSDGTLLLQRKLASDGKNTVHINGKPGNVALLKEIGTHIINIHGQHDNQTLLSASNHIRYLDAVGDLGSLRSEYQSAFQVYLDWKEKYQRLCSTDTENEERLELLRYQIQELENAEIEVGERAELTLRRDRIRASETIAKSLSDAISCLEQDGGGIAQSLRNAAKMLDSAAHHENQVQTVQEKLNDYGYEIREETDVLLGILDSLEFDPQLLEDIEARLDYLFRLSRKYGETEEDMIAYLERATTEVHELENRERSLAQVQERLSSSRQEAERLARLLSEQRQAVATTFCAQVCRELKDLDMPKVAFSCRMDSVELNHNGADDVEFMISVNPGEPPKPMAKIASGGELSRIMLAIKTVLAEKDDIPTLIFDEIDTGISGHAAMQVGLKLKHVSRSEQILCVTHLAPIAAMADHHFRVEKTVRDERTFTSVDCLDDKDREREIARILSGGSSSETMLASARELIDKGK